MDANTKGVSLEIIKMLRQEKKITQQAMADHLDIDRSTYTKMESGKIGISSESAARIAFKLGVQVAELYEEDPRTRMLRSVLRDIDDDLFTDDNGNKLSQSKKDSLKAKVYELLAAQ